MPSRSPPWDCFRGLSSSPGRTHGSPPSKTGTTTNVLARKRLRARRRIHVALARRCRHVRSALSGGLSGSRRGRLRDFRRGRVDRHVDERGAWRRRGLRGASARRRIGRRIARWRPLGAALVLALHPALVPYTAALMTEGATAALLGHCGVSRGDRALFKARSRTKMRARGGSSTSRGRGWPSESRPWCGPSASRSPRCSARSPCRAKPHGASGSVPSWPSRRLRSRASSRGRFGTASA